MGMRALAAKYGSIAVGTYLTISFATFCTFFVAIENHLDVEAGLKWALGTSIDVETTLKAWGLSKKTLDEAEGEHEDSIYRYIISKAPSAAMALLISKSLIPIKVPLAAALTPTVSRILQARGAARGHPS